MFLNSNVSGNRVVNRRAPNADAGLSPRFARLVRESWWLLVVAAAGYLALILASYTSTDPGWSFSGTGAPLGNRGGVVGAWIADLLLYLFGASAWWFAIGSVVLVIAGFRRVVRPEESGEHPLLFRLLGFGLVIVASAALEALRVLKIGIPLPLAPGGAFGDMIGGAASRAFGLNGATLLFLALLAVGLSLLFGISWLRVMERIGAGLESLVSRIRKRREQAIDRRIGEEAAAEREQVVMHLREEVEEREPIVVVPPPRPRPSPIVS